MLATPTGRFPIVQAGEHPLRAAVEAWRARGDTTPAAATRDPELRAAQETTAHDLVAAQEAAGLDLLGDGWVPVYDEWFAWLPTVTGARDGGLIRYLDTNTYYHRWHLLDAPGRCGDGPAVAAYTRAAALTRRPVKPCLFGPYTLWAYAVQEGMGATARAFDALLDIWAAEVAALAAAGARMVQIEESVLLRPGRRRDLPLVARAIERLAAAAPGVTLVLHLAGGAVGDLLGPLLDLPGPGGLGLDFTDVYRASNLAALAGWRGDKLLQAGVLDARSVRLESVEELHRLLAAITRRVPAERCLAAPSTALLHLPRHIAFDKLARLVLAAHTFAPEEVMA